MPKQRHVLITFLGRGNKTPGREGYNKATYDFGSDHTEASRVFGIALLRHLGRYGHRRVDDLVVVGTAGSDWDIFYDELNFTAEDAADRDAAFEEQIALSAATRADSVSDERVAPLAARLSRALGVRCRSCIIPYGLNPAEQNLILRRLVDHVRRRDHVTLDLTHGLRHLPVFGFIAALYLRAARKAEIEAVYYGALDLSSKHPKGQAWVLPLGGLLEIADWIQALQTFDKDGDYGVFAPLLQREGVRGGAAMALGRAAALERTTRIPEARDALLEFRDKAGDLSRFPGPAALFAVPLAERLAWADEEGLYAHQRRLAFLHLKHGDYLRAALFGQEAFVTLIEEEFRAEADAKGKTPFEAFKGKVERARKALRRNHSPDHQAIVRRKKIFNELNDFRNAVTHVDSPYHWRVGETLRSIDRTGDELQSWLTELLPERTGDAQPSAPAAAVPGL